MNQADNPNTQAFRLAFAISWYFPYGGLQRDMHRIARECVRRGHTVDVYTGAWDAELPGDFRVRVLDERALSNSGWNRKFGRALGRAVAGGDYDCVVGFTKIPGLDVYYAGDPCYAAKVDATKGALYKLLPRYHGMKRLEAAVFAPGCGTEILLIAHQERDKFIRYYGTEAARFHLLPPGIDREQLLVRIPNRDQKQAFRREFGIDEDGLMLLNVGSAFRTKGVDRLIRALAALPGGLRERSKLIVVGDDEAAPFQRLAAELGVGEQVVFTGARDDVAMFYHSADLLVHPSYSENTGTTILEAMVCALPVLTTENCGFAAHVREADAGLVCPVPFDQAQFDHLLVEMLTSNLRQQWQKNALYYCQTRDLYSLIGRAVDIIVARAARGRAGT